MEKVPLTGYSNNKRVSLEESKIQYDPQIGKKRSLNERILTSSIIRRDWSIREGVGRKDE